MVSCKEGFLASILCYTYAGYGYGGNITISSGSKVVATSSDYGEAQDLVNRLDGYIDHSGMKTDDTAYAGGIVSIGAFKAWK